MRKLNLIRYSFGSTGLNILAFFITSKLVNFYDDKDGNVIVPLILVSAAVIIGRVIDSFTDPFFGNLSDKSNNKVGRRKFFILLSIPFIIASFIFIWLPPFRSANSEILNFIFLFIIVNVYFSSYTMFAIPYDSHITEISKTKKDRLTASALKAVFGILGVVIAIIIMSIFTIVQSAFVLAAICLISFIITTTGIKEDKVHTSNNYKLIDSMKMAFGKKVFLKFCLFILIIDSACNIFIKDVEYFSQLILAKSVAMPKEALSGILFGTFIIGVIISVFFWSYISNKYTKKRALKSALIYLAILFPFYFFIGYISLISVLITAGFYFLLIGFGYGAINLITVAMLGDITDNHLEETGQKREALYFGVYNFTKKMGLALGMLFFTINIELYEYFGYKMLGYRMIGPLICILVFIAYKILSTISIAESSDSRE